MSQDEFHRAYMEMSEDFKAELIEGEVFVVNDNIGFETHEEPDAELAGWMLIYRVETPGVASGTAATTILDNANEVEPDLQMRIRPEYRGRSVLGGEFVQGPPELVCEISYSSRSIDLGRKKRAYEKTGIQEYLVWRTVDKAIDWWEIRGGLFQPLPKQDDGLIESRVFPGLVLDTVALLGGNMKRVLDRQRAELGQGRHMRFCEVLQSRLTAAAP